MSDFLVGHATHPDWRMALALAAAQIGAQTAQHDVSGDGPLTLGFVYLTDAYAAHAGELLAELQARWRGVDWVGSVGVGVAASGVEYFDEPALVVMLAALPAGRYEVFSGAHPLSRIEPYSALVHADPATPDLAELIVEMSDRTTSGYLFGGVASSRHGGFHIANGVWQGGLSGVAFTDDVALLSRVTQGCQPIGPVRRITLAERNLVVELDGEPALACLLRDIGVDSLDDPRVVLPRLRGTLVGLSAAHESPLGRGGQFGAEVRVRHLVGLDPARHAVAVADMVEPGMRLAFCTRDVAAARRDLVRACSEIREELSPDEPASATAGVLPEQDEREARGRGTASGSGLAGASPGASPFDAPQARPVPRRVVGAIYVSCTGRGGPHFGGASAEMQVIRHALGDVPLAGFFAGGEIARHHLYGYTGVLTVFTGAPVGDA
jgi:small ligand-binding sensory domain FIST